MPKNIQITIATQRHTKKKHEEHHANA